MDTFQHRFLAHLEQKIQSKGFECSQSQDWSNTGTINIHMPGVITPFMQINYNFQPDTYCMSIEVHGKRIPSQPGRNDYFSFYQKNNEPTNFWNAFEREINAILKPVISAK